MAILNRRSQLQRAKRIRLILYFLSIVLFLFFFVRLANLKPHFSLGSTPTPFPSPTIVPTPTITPSPTLSPTPPPTPTATPTPTPTPTSMPATSFESYFDEYSTQYQISKDMLKKIAFCESGVSPGATNGPYGGMFQFTTETWKVTREQMGADSNPDLRFGAKEAIETAAFKISRGGIDAWKNCAR